MAAELVNMATSEKLNEMDWAINIQICELVARDQGEAKDVIKALKRRLLDKNPNTQLFAVMLLEVLFNNCGEYIHRHVTDIELLPVLVKIVKKKLDLSLREKIFVLLETTQASLGGASGKFPQYFAAYSELVSAGIQFPQTPHVLPPDPTPVPHKSISSKAKSVPSKGKAVAQQSGSQDSPESSIIQKARAVLDLLREVLSAIDFRHPEGAKDEFTLDLVEQCSFQKQRVMHVVLTCRNEKVLSQAIELNEQLEEVLSRHDALISVRPASTATPFFHEESGEEEESDQLIRRIQKGKGRVKFENEDQHNEKAPGSLFGRIQQERLHRPIIRPTGSEPKESSSEPLPPPHPVVVIPPPPAKRVERERFFQENHVVDVSALPSQMEGVSLNGRSSTSEVSDSTPS